MQSTAQTSTPVRFKENPICRFCQNGELIPKFTTYGFDSVEETFSLYSCVNCEMTCIYPILTLRELEKYYHSNYYGGGDSKNKSGNKFVGWVEQIVNSGNRVRAKKLVSFLEGSLKSDVLNSRLRILDVGCGRGGFLEILARQGFQCVGTDITRFEKNPQSKVEFHEGPLEMQNFKTGSFNAVSIWHVLEHVQDPDSTVLEISRILKTGGILAIAVPNFGSWQAKIFGKHWFHLDLPRHLFHFSDSTLRALLSAHGFEILETQTLSWDQNLFGWIQSFQNVLFHRTNPNGLFAVLKKTKLDHKKSKLLLTAEFLFLSGIASLSLIPAFIDTVVSAFFQRGATLIVHAKKTASRLHQEESP